MKRRYLSYVVIFFVIYFVLYKYFFDGFCYIRSNDYLKCSSTFICKPDRNILIDTKMMCMKKPVFLYEKDSFLYKKQTYINIYNNFIDSIKN